MDPRDDTTTARGAQGEDGSSPRLFITANPGLEDVVQEELQARLRARGLPPPQVQLRPFGFGGQVLVEGAGADGLCDSALRLRSAHHVLVLLHRFALPAVAPLDFIGRQLEVLPVPPMRAARRFRVTSKRSGAHDFTSLDVQRVAGAGLVAHYGRDVDLEHFDLEVRVDVLRDICLVGYQLTRQALHKRFPRRFQPRAALNASVAYALLHLARAERYQALLDPFCGSGTILFEAARAFPHLELCGSDLDRRALEGARANMAAQGLAGRVEWHRADARKLERELGRRRFDLVVTNPPYGLRCGRHLNFARFYAQVLRQVWGVLRPGGRLVLLAWKRHHFVRALRQSGLFQPRHERVVETGDLYPRLFVLDRTEGEEGP